VEGKKSTTASFLNVVIHLEGATTVSGNVFHRPAVRGSYNALRWPLSMVLYGKKKKERE